MEQLQVESRCIVQHPEFKELVYLFCYQTSLHSTSLIFILFVSHPVVFCPYRKCQRG